MRVCFGQHASANEHSQRSPSTSSHSLLLSQGYHESSVPVKTTRDQEVQTEPEGRYEHDIVDYLNTPVLEWAGQPVGVSDTLKWVDPQLNLPPPVDPATLAVTIEANMPLDGLGVRVSYQAIVVQSCCTCARSVTVAKLCAFFASGRFGACVKLGCIERN